MANKNEETDPKADQTAKANAPAEGAAKAEGSAPADTSEAPAPADAADEASIEVAPNREIVLRHEDGKLTADGVASIAYQAVNQAHSALGTNALVAFEDVVSRVHKRLWDPNGAPDSPHVEDVLIAAIAQALAPRTKR